MRERPRFSISPVRTPDDLAAAVDLFSAYEASLDIDLAYQNFDAEIAGMRASMLRQPVSCCLLGLPMGPRWVVSGSGPLSRPAAVR